ncbi:hypothetical protein R1T16_05840 [Flavobacterium sp. DG1-102-2]|uniref:hypothetical protein n=1 Tax=Flavobacterium sp. DG1-102-2 TaxID=3081663 RepID=UPI00294930B5|nr:hypothetical protein [Flavobacterium sp. DG1-102-2]MDV6167937.1 hypothetical protein [Flavobacterium sp. DG1-102-2]
MEQNEPLFYEEQYFRQWWIFILLAGMCGTGVYGVITQVFMGETFGDKPMGDVGLIIFSVCIIALTIFFYMQKMITKIDERGIYIKFRPYHKKWRLYEWQRIAHCELKKYNPTFEFGGWGIRPGVNSVSGNSGLLLHFKSGKPKLMIGTRKTEEMQQVLQTLNQL